jgi:site-specific recombinase XerD
VENVTLKLVQDFSKLIEDFCKDCRLRGMTVESIRRYQSSLNMFADYFNKANLTEVNMPMLKDFLGYLKFERAVKQKTIENDFSALSSFYDYLVFEEITNQNTILPFRRRYLKMYKKDSQDSQRSFLMA